MTHKGIHSDALFRMNVSSRAICFFQNIGAKGPPRGRQSAQTAGQLFFAKTSLGKMRAKAK
jgi:hypothetical protein